MEKPLTIRIEDFGVRVVSVWEGLRPATRGLVERALVSAQAPTTAGATGASRRAGATLYDARAEWELSRLLAALDDRVMEAGVAALSGEQILELKRMAETCALVLHNEAHSAETFAQLLERALQARNYARVDALADTLAAHLAPSEICELARHPAPAVRAIAQEALLQMPTPMLVSLLSDPVDMDVARDALERQAEEYGSEEASWIVSALERADAAEEEDM